jgi:hypothetical protein
VTDFLSGIVTLPDKIVHKLSDERLEGSVFIDVWEDQAGQLLVRRRRLLSFASVLDDVLDDGSHASTRRDVSVGLPGERKKTIVLVDPSVVAWRVIQEPGTLRVVLDLGLVPVFIWKVDSALLLTSLLVQPLTVRVGTDGTLNSVHELRQGNCVVLQVSVDHLHHGRLLVRASSRVRFRVEASNV